MLLMVKRCGLAVLIGQGGVGLLSEQTQMLLKNIVALAFLS